MIIINGEKVDNVEGLNVIQLLEHEGYPTRMIAVEVNGEIIPRKDYETHHFKDGDTIEVVRFVGGG